MRFAYLDNIRSLVIFLVITTHTEIIYSSYGFWPYIEGSPEKLSDNEAAFFGLYGMFTHAWSMGILFFISAYFSTKSLAKRGAVKYMKERLFRLGVPLLISIFIFTPFIEFVLLGKHNEITLGQYYLDFIVSSRWLSSAGPLWFATVLLIFCTLYVLYRKIVHRHRVILAVNLRHIVSVIVGIGVFAFLIRLVFPINTRFFNLNICYFASYIVMFMAGISVGENNLMEQINREKNIVGMKLALVIGIPLWGIIMIVGGPLYGNMYIYGGFRWQSLVFAFWESFVAIGFSIGIIAFFKKYLDTANRYSELLAQNSFGMYVFHSPLLTAIALSLKQWETTMFTKFAIVLPIAYVASFLFTFLIRKIKPVGIIFK